MTEPDNNIIDQVDQEAQDQRAVDARELADTVDEHLRAGKPTAARRAFSRGWRDAVPDLPLRFEVILMKPEKAHAKKLRRTLLDGADAPELKLVETADGDVEVRDLDGRRLGALPGADVRLLAELGADASLYRPHLLEIRFNEKNKFSYVAVELSRPEVRYCSACGEKHSGPHVNCDKCRSKRRPKGDERFEPSPVSFHDALDSIVQEGDGGDETGDLPV